MSTEIDALIKGILSEQELRVVERETPTEGHRVQPVVGTFVDHSGALAAANTSQLLMKENPDRRYLLIQNTSMGDLWINFSLGAQTQSPSIKISAGGSFVMESSFVSTEAIYVIGATSGQTFTAKEA